MTEVGALALSVTPPLAQSTLDEFLRLRKVHNEHNLRRRSTRMNGHGHHTSFEIARTLSVRLRRQEQCEESSHNRHMIVSLSTECYRVTQHGNQRQCWIVSVDARLVHSGPRASADGQIRTSERYTWDTAKSQYARRKEIDDTESEQGL